MGRADFLRSPFECTERSRSHLIVGCASLALVRRHSAVVWSLGIVLNQVLVAKGYNDKDITVIGTLLTASGVPGMILAGVWYDFGTTAVAWALLLWQLIVVNVMMPPPIHDRLDKTHAFRTTVWGCLLLGTAPLVIIYVLFSSTDAGRVSMPLLGGLFVASGFGLVAVQPALLELGVEVSFPVSEYSSRYPAALTHLHTCLPRTPLTRSVAPVQ